MNRALASICWILAVGGLSALGAALSLATLRDQRISSDVALHNAVAAARQPVSPLLKEIQAAERDAKNALAFWRYRLAVSEDEATKAKLLYDRYAAMQKRHAEAVQRKAAEAEIAAARNELSAVEKEIAAERSKRQSTTIQMSVPTLVSPANPDAGFLEKEVVASRLKDAERQVEEVQERLAGTLRQIGAEPNRDIDEVIRMVTNPAKVALTLDARMFVGERYEVRLMMSRSGQALPGTATPPVLIADTNVTRRARATLESALFKIERLNDEWQDWSTGAAGLWLWRLEPLKSGRLDLVVSVQNAVKIDGAERTITAQHFPQIVIVDVSWWDRAKMAVAGITPAGQAATAVATAIGAVGTALLAWWARRRPRPAKRTAAKTKSPKGKG